MHTVYGERSLFLTRLLVYIIYIMNFRELFLITTLRSPGMHSSASFILIFFINIFKKKTILV